MSVAQEQNGRLVAHLGKVDVDVPRSVGYFGAIGLAVAFEVIEWPVGLFIAAIPFVKMLNRRKLPDPVRFVEHVLDGAAKPVGGDSEGTIRVAGQQPSSVPPSTDDANAGKGQAARANRQRSGAASGQAEKPAPTRTRTVSSRRK
jgi:hypothetical protein